MRQHKKLKILVIDWFIILGVYVLVRLMFMMLGLQLHNTVLRICLAIFPYLLGALYLCRFYKQESVGFYSLALIFPSIIEKITVYLLGSYLYDINPLKLIKVIDAIASNRSYANVNVNQSIRYVINLPFFNLGYIILSIVFPCVCTFFLVKNCRNKRR